MKKILVLAVPIFILVAILAIPVSAQVPCDNPYCIESRCEFNDGASAGDPSANGNSRVCLTKTTKEGCEAFSFCWWRDTTNQNVLSQHSADEWGTPAVYPVYTSSDLTVLMYNPADGPKVTAIITSTSLLLVGPGGGRNEANNAKLAFQNYFAGFTNKRLMGIILPHVYEEDSWGVTYWRSIFRSNPPAPMIVNASYERARQNREEVKNEYLERQDRAYMGDGQVCTNPSDPNTCTYFGLSWGTDSLLGSGSMKEYRPNLASFIPPGATDVLISADTDITMDGITVRLIPTSDEDAGLLTYLPNQKVLIAGNLGKLLPDAGSIAQPNVPIDKWIATLDKMRTLAPDYLITGRGMYIAGQEAVNSALTVQYDALKYLQDETLKYINEHVPFDDIVNLVKLPSNLASSPYASPLTSTEPGIVRAIYHDHLGWFDGDVANLESLSTAEQARRLIAFGGGEKQVLSYVKKCITEHSRAGAIQALKMTSALRQIYPSKEADAIYIQALKMLGWTTPSAHLRNYYLSEARKIELGL